MNLSEASLYLNRNVDEVRKMAAKGIIPGTKIEAEWFFYQVDLDKWAESHPKQTYKLNLSDEDLKELIQDGTYNKAAEALRVTPTAIGYRMRKQGLRRYKKN